MFQGLGHPAGQRGEEIGQVEMGEGKLGIEAQRRLEVRECLRRAAGQRDEDIRQVELGRRVSRIEAERLLIFADGLRWAAGVPLNLSQAVVGEPRAGIAPQRVSPKLRFAAVDPGVLAAQSRQDGANRDQSRQQPGLPRGAKPRRRRSAPAAAPPAKATSRR